MSFDWTRYRLEELGDIVTGKTPPSKVQDAFSYSGTQFVTPRDMDGRRWIDSTERFLSESGVAAVKNSLVPSGSVAVSCIGSDMGKAVLLKVESVTNQQINTLVVDTQKFNAKFVYYVLSTKQDEFKSIAGGSATPILNKGHFGKFEIDLPTKDEQDFLVRCLDSLDSKIENNTQANQTLEQIAQALFKSWFVDFDPVKAKIDTLAAGGSDDDAELAAMSVISAKTVDELNSLKTSNPEAFNKLAQTAALFPAAMQDSELGEIPEGWEVSDLASCTTELRRGISPKYIEEGGVLVINQKCIRNHTVDFSLARRNDSSKRKVDGREIAIGDVLVNSTGVGTLGRLAPIRFLNETTVADSHVTVVRANTTKISKSFLAGLMLTNEAYIEASGAGSTGQTELRKQVLEAIKFAKPLNAVDKLFDEIVGNFNAQVAELEKQKVTLSLTRDALLPKLLSGELVGE
tara:strand:- start:770 stop:2149 length:1380 start_codon:yes stop_codon:yes gene_type:complete